MAGIFGLGFVGSAVRKSFDLLNVEPLYGYDKFKDGGIGTFEDCLKAPIVFLCLPTPYDEALKSYDKSAIEETLGNLQAKQYEGVVVLKSTVEPGTTERYSRDYPALSICHNPEFLSAATAFQDFHDQTHIVIGKGPNCSNNQIEKVSNFFRKFYPNATVSNCSSSESESMKSFVNCFYSVKIQFFNEMYLLCKNQNVDFTRVKELMLMNGWINPMHTNVPGPDRKLSYGGSCFPKDTNALLQHMIREGTPHSVLDACVLERNRMRDDHVNCFSKKNTVKKIENGFSNGHVNGYSNGHVTNGYTNGNTNGYH